MSDESRERVKSVQNSDAVAPWHGLLNHAAAAANLTKTKTGPTEMLRGWLPEKPSAMDRDGGEVTANALLKRNFPRRVNALVDQTTGRKFTRSEDPDAIQIAQNDTNPKKIWVDKSCLIF